MAHSHDGGGCQRPRSISFRYRNMRTLVESDGSIATCVSRQGGRGVAVDMKALLMVRELRRFGMSMVGKVRQSGLEVLCICRRVLHSSLRSCCAWGR